MSDEEDYMSESFLSKMPNVAPGVSTLPSQRRMLKLSSRKEIADEEIRSRPKKAEIEKQRREEALAKPVGEESKGFALLAKMGYKPGMTLGKKRDGEEKPTGLKVPIPIEMKEGRGGLGHDTHQKEQAHKRIELHMKRMEFQAKYQNVLLSDFRKRKRDTTMIKQLVGDLVKSRKACQELDTRQDRSEPAEPWFWPIYVSKKAEPEDELNLAMKSFKRDPEEDDECAFDFKYSNGKPAPPEEPLNDMTEEELNDRLKAITEFLRGAHRYCIWCGYEYDSQEEMLNECPGPSRMNHESDE